MKNLQTSEGSKGMIRRDFVQTAFDGRTLGLACGLRLQRGCL
jgi:hypothetical protein